eukprot:TRINITY_DN13465_c1_g1_i1.p3 TRINITY_DN13465_c1_g1~~TRINITY_DN13465_c1_g1_i1.p3  ORF type:complete len:109 (+),score=36.74 TRINITY_DN13465_c1_g1_i1:70-396(+)
MDIELVGVAVAGFLVGLAVYHFALSSKKVNLSVEKGSAKVVNKLPVSAADIEDMCKNCPDGLGFKAGGENVVLCRCWRSKKFPYCDGSHVQHNKETGDNVGPLILHKK